MTIKLILLVTLLVTLLGFSSCAPTRNLVYFSDLNDAKNYTEKISNKIDPIIQPDDILNISVSSLNPESNVLFNNGTLQVAGSGASSTVTANRNFDGYLVDKKGSINFPVLGNIQLGGLTREQAIDKLTIEVKKSVKNPIINIRFVNFRITVIGEVTRPSTFTIPSERVNLLEALGLAGDLTVYGKRENILVIREKDGVRSAARINLASKDALNSPYFYLQQNDVVYVEPTKVKALQSSNSTFYLPLVSLAVSLLGVLIIVLR